MFGPLRYSQRYILESLLDGGKYRALAALEATRPDDAYLLNVYLADVQAGVWRELGAAQPVVDTMRRDLQRHYLDIVQVQLKTFDMESALGDPSVAGTDFGGLARSNLRALLSEINTALPKVTDAATRAHLEDARDYIEKMLKI